ncbi:MAG: hypothetical protein KKE11_06510 [Gammaproteobacteria bacterium]|nr:hypothetical protein [Gammaproteobacteria bacterium]
MESNLVSMAQEVSIKNPRKRLSDNFPVWVRVSWKKFIAPIMGNPQHQTIIPNTANHNAWVLGAQPDHSVIKTLQMENNNLRVHIVSMLADDERIITDKSQSDGISEIDRNTWLDHGVITVSGLNQTVDDMYEFQQKLYKKFDKADGKDGDVFYCHCMAGRSRSFVETMAFLYFHPDKTTLFDFEDPAWDDIKKKIPEDLQKRLQAAPTFSDIAEYVQLLRPKVKKFRTLDGDQAGLVGLMALSKASNENPSIKEQLSEIQPQENVSKLYKHLYREALDIGLILKAPLDASLRDQKDRKAQEDNLAQVYKAYQFGGVNLLAAMIVPKDAGKTDFDYERYNFGVLTAASPVAANQILEKNFFKNFENLSPSEQARLVILMKGLEERGCDLGKLYNPDYFALQVMKNVNELTVGDRVELLRCKILDLDYKDVVARVLKGNKIDRYNAGIQLAELYNIASSNKEEVGSVRKVIVDNKLSYVEQFNFVKRLHDLGSQDVHEYAKMVLNNYDNRWFPFFNNPVSSEQKKSLQEIINPKKEKIITKGEEVSEQDKTIKDEQGILKKLEEQPVASKVVNPHAGDLVRSKAMEAEKIPIKKDDAGDTPILRAH